MKLKITVFLSIIHLITINCFSQSKGTLKGTITDGDFGGPIVGATVYLTENKIKGVVTDFDGNYSIKLNPGTYSISVSFVSYETLIFESITIKANETTVLNGTIKSKIEELLEIEIIEKVNKNTEVGLLIERKNATAVVDGISSKSLKKIGDSDLSGAMRRVTGVTVQSGKYVYVRGLGDRYTKTTLNGMLIPGLDPDVNAVPINIFPTSVIENISVYKTYNPDQYGDYTGGLVNISTKKTTGEKKLQLTLGSGFAFGMQFNPNFILYNTGKLNLLGIDDGKRALPLSKNENIPQEPLLDPNLEILTRAFSKQMAVEKKTAIPNTNLIVNFENRIPLKDSVNQNLGYNIVFNYRNNYIYYDELEQNKILKDVDESVNNLFVSQKQNGSVGKNIIQWSIVSSIIYNKKKKNFSSILFHSQNAASTASKRIRRDFNQTSATLYENLLTYSQKSLSSWILNYHQHHKDWEINIGNAINLSRVYDPDFRTTTYSLINDDTTFNIGDGAGINRFWRDLKETNQNFKIDLEKKINVVQSFKFGMSELIKKRDFSTLSYKFDTRNKSNISGNPNSFFESNNIWTSTNRNGTYVRGNYEPANNYTASQSLFSGYLMGKTNLYDNKLKFIYGIRAEKINMFYTGEDNSGLKKFNNKKTLNELNILPSFTSIYKINRETYLRFTASQTIARPSFKEKSIAQIIDPITGIIFIGNIDLKQTSIFNLDLRYEWYFRPTELISISVFNKELQGHIELTPNQTNPNELKPRNSGNAFIRGIEIELRKKFNNITNNKHINRFSISGNLTWVKSGVNTQDIITDNFGKTEYQSRKKYLRSGEKLSIYRDMAGQSPYTINTSIFYDIFEKSTSISLSYNVQGEQLTTVGSGRIPDIYTTAYHSLNFNTLVSFGKNLKSKINFKIINLLDQTRHLYYKSYGAGQETFLKYKEGVQVYIKYIYTF